MNFLSPFGDLYGRIIDLRNYLYDRGIFKSHDLGARTISVGNLTTGGTGKTPLVALIAEILAENGEKVCILTRGYGRKNERDLVLVSDGKQVLVDAAEGGDEPVELANKLIGKAIVISDADRVAAAKWAMNNFEITVFILDDGFQHRRAKRDLDIVCVDATNPCGNGKILPAGRLRESLVGLKRADAVVMTRTEQVVDVKDLTARLRARNADIPLFRSTTTIAALFPLQAFLTNAERGQDHSIEDAFVFCGIANAESFFRSLEKSGVNITRRLLLPDHEHYGPNTLKRIENEASASNSKTMVTTAKDAVKLKGIKFTRPCYVALAETLVDDIAAFRNLLISS